MDVDATPNSSPVRSIGETSKPQEAEPAPKEGEVGIKAAQFVIEKTDIRKHYDFEKLLGTGELSLERLGAYGKVYLGKNRLTGDKLAIKEIAKELTTKESNEKLLEEIKILNELVGGGKKRGVGSSEHSEGAGVL